MARLIPLVLTLLAAAPALADQSDMFPDSAGFQGGIHMYGARCTTLERFEPAMDEAGFMLFSPGREAGSGLPSRVWFERDGKAIAVSHWTGNGYECVVHVHVSMPQ